MIHYFEDREVSGVCEATNGQIGLIYKEGSAIPNEVLHKDEWEAGQSEQPSQDRQAIFVKSSHDLQTRILQVFEEHNVRFNEIDLTLSWIKSAFDATRDRLLNAIYGTKDWLAELSVDMLGDCPDLEEGETADALAVYLLLRERGIKLRQVNQVLQQVTNMVNRQQVARIEQAVGRPMQYWRLDDLAQYIEAKEYANNQTNTQGTENNTDDGFADPDASVGEDEKPSLEASDQERPETGLST